MLQWLLGFVGVEQGPWHPINGIGSLRDPTPGDIRDPIIDAAKKAQRTYDLAMAVGSEQERAYCKYNLDSCLKAMREAGFMTRNWW